MRSSSPPGSGRGDLGFERTLWAAADKLRNNVDAGEYKHIVLGLVFLKFISANDGGAFVVPEEARWSALEARAKGALDGRVLDLAMEAIERCNPALRGALPKVYARCALDDGKLGELVTLLGTIGVERARSRDVLGRIYEYFLAAFASAEGQRGGQFYTPRSLVQLLVEMLAPERGKIYDPCCGSGGMFVQAERFASEHGGAPAELAFYGQESNATTFRLARMNMAIRGIQADLGPRHADTFLADLHDGLRADFVLANPPFNAKEWGKERLGEDRRFSFGLPPAGNANFAWVQHILAHLSPTGVAGFILANGSLSSSQGGEGEIRRALVEADLVDCVVTLPDKLFYSTQIPVSLWIVTFAKRGGVGRDRAGETLFIDARGAGAMIDRTHRVLTGEDIARIASTYRAYRGDHPTTMVHDVPGFSRAVDLAEIARHKFALVPGRFVGFARRAAEAEALACLRGELGELSARVLEVAGASSDALALLKGVLGG